MAKYFKSLKKDSPFNMLGSWVGAGIGLLISLLPLVFVIIGMFHLPEGSFTEQVKDSTIFTITGFLIGWQIQLRMKK